MAVKEVFKVYSAEYMGEDYWFDYPPYEFDSLDSAKDFVLLLLSQSDKTKVRDVTSNVRTVEWKEWFNG